LEACFFTENLIKNRFIMNKKVLIAGGAGFLGCRVSEYLLQNGFDIKIIDNTQENVSIPDSVEFVRGDIRDYDFLQQELLGIDYVINAIGIQPFSDSKDIYSVNVEGTRSLLKASKEHSVKRFVHISSSAVYGIPEFSLLSEEYPFKGKGAHCESKILAEQNCESFRKQGMVVTIFRAPPLIGPGRLGIFSVFFNWVEEKRAIPLIGRGNNKIQFLGVDDLCDAILKALMSSEEKVNDTFNIGAEDFNSIKDDLTAFIKGENSYAKIISFPSGFIKFILIVFEKLKISPFYKGVYEIFDKDISLSVKKINKQLSWRAKQSNVDALRSGYKWYLKNKDLPEYLKNTNRGYMRQGILGIVRRLF